MRALAHIAAAGRAALGRLVVADLPPAAELHAAMAAAAPGGIALELGLLEVECRETSPAPDDQQAAWLCSVVARVDRVDVLLGSASALGRGIFALPAAAFRLHVDLQDGGGRLLEAVRFAVEAARPGQHVSVWAEDGAVSADTIAEADAIAHGALDKDIRVQIDRQAA